MAERLTAAGLSVLAIERGGWRDTPNDFATTFDQDELRYMWRHHLFENVAHDTLTFRNRADEIALPMRRLGSFLPGTGVGGAGVHWNGQVWRFLPSDFKAPQPQPRALRQGGRSGDMTIAGLSASATTSSSRTTTRSNISAASRARPAI